MAKGAQVLIINFFGKNHICLKNYHCAFDTFCRLNNLNLKTDPPKSLSAHTRVLLCRWLIFYQMIYRIFQLQALLCDNCSVAVHFMLLCTCGYHFHGHWTRLVLTGTSGHTFGLQNSFLFPTSLLNSSVSKQVSLVYYLYVYILSTISLWICKYVCPFPVHAFSIWKWVKRSRRRRRRRRI